MKYEKPKLVKLSDFSHHIAYGQGYCDAGGTANGQCFTGGTANGGCGSGGGR